MEVAAFVLWAGHISLLLDSGLSPVSCFENGMLADVIQAEAWS